MWILCTFLVFSAFIHINAGKDSPTTDIQPRVAGGQIAAAGDVPYIAQIRSYGFFLCVATILNENTLLGTYKCVCVFGCVAIVGRTASNKGGQKFRVTRVIWHSNKILKLIKTEKITFSPHVSPVRLPTHDLKDDTLVIISGWGGRKWGVSIYEVQDLFTFTKIVFFSLS